MAEPASHRAAPVSGRATVRLRVLLFSVLRDRIGTDVLTLMLEPPVTGTDLLDRLADEHPAVDAYRTVIRLAVNESYAPPDAVLHDGDEVALITPVSGG